MDKGNIFVSEGQTTLDKTHQSHDSNPNFFNPNWENSMDQNDPFESALSSMVSSPSATSNNGGENNNMFQLRELIGRLGSISNSNNYNNNRSTNTSCYTTPLNSPPKHFPPFSTDASFAERAAKFSSFSGFNRNFHPSDGICDSIENSENNTGSRKRKAIPKGGKGKDPITPTPAIEEKNAKQVEKSGKRSKTDEKKELNEGPKDYIHVRARRGQATDAHSLAERVRREKISEKMKCLQDLVPGCNKVTGKAVMLDEIINYVQSLQRQVEFLSMKLATVDPRMDLNTEALIISKDIFQSRDLLLYSSDSSYQFQSLSNLHNGIGTNDFNAAIGRNELPPIDNFSEAASQVSTFWEDDLHSIVQMGFGQNQTQNFHGIIPKAQMKVEL